jgi:transposase-like protein
LGSSSGDTNDSTQDNPVSIPMSPRQLPGVYMVLCLVNNKRYYGQSKNVSSRLSQHKSRLRRNIHEVPELQRDFNLYGEINFQFSAIYQVKDFTLDQRVELEIELIGRFHNLCYNKSDKNSHKKENNPFWGRTHSDETRKQIAKSRAENTNDQGLPISLNGVIYPSISEASRKTTHSRHTIRRWLKDDKKTNCVAVTDQGVVKAPSGFGLSQDPLVENKGLPKRVSIYGVIYPSITEASRQRNCSRVIIQRFLRNDPTNCFIVP